MQQIVSSAAQGEIVDGFKEKALFDKSVRYEECFVDM
jgi:hypothetical protein